MLKLAHCSKDINTGLVLSMQIFIGSPQRSGNHASCKHVCNGKAESTLTESNCHCKLFRLIFTATWNESTMYFHGPALGNKGEKWASRGSDCQEGWLQARCSSVEWTQPL